MVNFAGHWRAPETGQINDISGFQKHKYVPSNKWLKMTRQSDRHAMVQAARAFVEDERHAKWIDHYERQRLALEKQKRVIKDKIAVLETEKESLLNPDGSVPASGKRATRIGEIDKELTTLNREKKENKKLRKTEIMGELAQLKVLQRDLTRMIKIIDGDNTAVLTPAEMQVINKHFIEH